MGPPQEAPSFLPPQWKEQQPQTSEPWKGVEERPEPEEADTTVEPQVASLPPLMSATECRERNELFGNDYSAFTRSPGLDGSLLEGMLTRLGENAETLWSQCAQTISKPGQLLIRRAFILFFLEDFNSSLRSFNQASSITIKPELPKEIRRMLRAFILILRDCSDQKRALEKFRDAQFNFQRELYENAKTLFTELRKASGLKCRPLVIYAGDQLNIISTFLDDY